MTKTITFDISLVTDRDVLLAMDKKVGGWADRKSFGISHCISDDNSILEVSYHDGTIEQHDRATLGLKGIIKRAKALNRRLTVPPPIPPPVQITLTERLQRALAAVERARQSQLRTDLACSRERASSLLEELNQASNHIAEALNNL